MNGRSSARSLRPPARSGGDRSPTLDAPGSPGAHDAPLALAGTTRRATSRLAISLVLERFMHGFEAGWGVEPANKDQHNPADSIPSVRISGASCPGPGTGGPHRPVREDGADQ